MLSKSLKQAMDAAEKEFPASAPGSDVWEKGEYEGRIVAANVKVFNDTPRIGLQVERSDGRRRWFDIYLDENNQKSFAASGRKLRALGLEETIDALETAHPDNPEAQLQGLADAMPGIVALFKIDKVEKKNAEGTFMNFMDVIRVISSETAPQVDTEAPTAFGGGFGGLMGN